MKGFVSVEAFLALLFAITSFAVLVPSLEARPSFLSVYEFQLAQDFAEVSLKNAETLEKLREFSGGSDSAGVWLEEKYERLAGGLGDYCVEIEVKERVLKAHCEREPFSKTSVSRMVFDGKDFFEVRFAVGFYS
ncbi:MAG: hypothetical protein V1717_00435 [Candidatus Micrarchaeota archaeon]